MDKITSRNTTKYLLWGTIATLGLLGFYILILGVLNGFANLRSQFSIDFKYLLPITVGFGIQIGLYKYQKDLLRQRHNLGISSASGGLSGISMIACCAHHLTDVLPIIGLTALTGFLGKYRSELLILAIFMNLLGILIILNNLRKIPRTLDNQP